MQSAGGMEGAGNKKAKPANLIKDLPISGTSFLLISLRRVDRRNQHLFQLNALVK